MAKYYDDNCKENKLTMTAYKEFGSEHFLQCRISIPNAPKDASHTYLTSMATIMSRTIFVSEAIPDIPAVS